MTAAAWVTFAVIVGFVWGGFLVLVVTALRKERGKAGEPDPDGPGIP